jgi:dehydrogenase/reductase SDR family protein 12
MLNILLDKSIYFSFNKSGFLRHAKSFKPLNLENLGTVLITGASSGIGKAVKDELIKNGSKCIVTARDTTRFKNEENVEAFALDQSNWEHVKSFASKLGEIDHLVLNAGGMPDSYLENEHGVEYQCSSQLIGHFLLFMELHKQKKLKPGAKIIITSSGGMLLKKLNLANLFQQKKYDKVATYANVKRAQVIAIDEFSKMFPEYQWASMHPGWVDTRAVQESIPKFYEFTQKSLRTPDQGADTILWLLSLDRIKSGYFWFDRRVAKQNPMPFTKETSQDREKLIKEILKICK